MVTRPPLVGGATSDHSYFGWRPALEILNTAPLISDSDKNLGSYAAPLVKSYTVSEADGEIFSILEQLDGSTIRSLNNQNSGSFTIDLTSRWGNLSKAAHTLKVTATDPHGAASVRTWTFTKTNTPSGKPTIQQPSAGQRIGTTVEVIFTPASDPDGDNQYFTLDVADDTNFSVNLKSVTSGLKKYNSTSKLWESASFAAPADVGKQFKLEVTGLNQTRDKYIRVATKDTNGSNTTVYSDVIKVSVGTRLSFKNLPQQLDYKPVSATIRLSGIIDDNATVQVEVCNNALDSTPTWENAMAAYNANQPHKFTNTSKTATHWAVATKVTIDANNSTGEISISAVGLGVK